MSARDEAAKVLAEHHPFDTGEHLRCRKCGVNFYYQQIDVAASHMADALAEAGLLASGERPAPESDVTEDEVALAIRNAGISGVTSGFIGPFDRSRANAVLAAFHVTPREDR